VLITYLEVLQQHGESACKEIKKNWNFFKEYALLCDERLEVMVTCMGTMASSHETHPYFSRQLVYGHMLTGTFLLIEVSCI
jgi:hypothetical protein